MKEVTSSSNEAGRPERYEVSSGQKVLYQLRLKVKGTSGHGSMPHSDNPNVKLVQALDRVTRWDIPYSILPMVKEFFLKMAPKQPPEERKFFEDIEKGLTDASFAKRLTSNPIYNAMVRDTVSLTDPPGGEQRRMSSHRNQLRRSIAVLSPAHPKKNFWENSRKDWEMKSRSR